jgi:hypothetical protein
MIKSVLKMIIVALTLTAVNSSCVSYYAIQLNKERVYKAEIAKRGYPEQAIVAYIDGDVVGMGIDITALQAATYDKESVLTQIGAAISDVLIGYGTYVYLTKDIPEE